jgi:hypothetical protein
MKKILLALTMLSVGAGAFQIARQSTNQLQEETAQLHQAWRAETQWLATAQIEQASLAERGDELKRTLALMPPAPVNELWLALQTNRADRLPGKLRKRLWQEFGFTWHSMKDYIVVSKHTVGKLGIHFMHHDGRLDDAGLGTLGITLEQRGQLEAAIEQAKTDFKDWVLGHVQRGEPAGDVVAKYTLPGDSFAAEGITNEFFTAVAEAVGGQRMELIQDTARNWMEGMGVTTHSTKLTIRREVDGDDSRLKVEMREDGRNKSEYLPLKDDDFPKALRVLFPNRWAGLAEREGFQLPKETVPKEPEEK